MHFFKPGTYPKFAPASDTIYFWCYFRYHFNYKFTL